MMHILIIPSEEFVPKRNHLAGIFQMHQALALKKAGFQVGVLSIRQSLSLFMLLKAILLRFLRIRPNNELADKNTKELFKLLVYKTFFIKKFITSEIIENINVYRIEAFYFLPPSKHTNYMGWLRGGMQLYKRYYEVEGTPNFIHAHNAVYAGILANKIAKKNKIPYFLTEHSSFVARNLESFLIKKKIEKAYKESTSLFVVSEFLGLRIKDLYPGVSKIKVVPNVLDPFIENAPMPSISSKVNHFLFISIASLIPIKRHEDLIKAFHQKFAGHLEVQLKIAGDGDLHEKLEHLILQLNLQEQVQLLGRKNRKEVLQLIDASQCLVLCSEIETFGVVLIEALSRGKPIIATRCGGPVSIVNEENGILCNIGDIEALGNAMRYVKDNYNKYDKNVIRKKTLKEYGSSPFAIQFKKEVEKYVSHWNTL